MEEENTKEFAIACEFQCKQTRTARNALTHILPLPTDEL